MAVKVVARRTARKASKPKKAKATRRATRRAVRKATKPKKAMKAKRAKKVTKKSQTGSMRQVWSGSKLYTKSGYMKKDLCVNPKNNKVLSKKRFAAAKKAGKGLSGWCNAVKQARKALNITGFVKMNRGAQGIALYKKAKAIYKN